MSIFSTPLKNNVSYNSNLISSNTFHDNIGSSNESIKVNKSILRDNKTKQLTLGNYNSLNNDNSLNLTLNNEHIRINGLGTCTSLDIASQYIEHLGHRDASTPILDERSYYHNGLTYNFSKEIGGLGAFTPFERTNMINIPDEILEEISHAEIKSDMGIFSELNRCWIIIDNKLILWNINDGKDFQCIDEIKHTILKVSLVKPKINTFIQTIDHLLLIATPFDIYILAVSHNEERGSLSVFNTGMCVSVHGLDVSEIISYKKTGQIFFVGKGNGINIWELQYSSTEDWFNSKCNKLCLTQSALSSLLPANIMSKIPGSGLFQYLFEDDSQYNHEHIIQLEIDESRGLLYTLSSNSVIRAYKINKKSLDGPITISPSYIKKMIGTTTAKGASILGNKYLKIIKISLVSQQENSNLFLIGITIGGVRLYFNGSLNSTNIDALNLESIKFPPSSITSEAIEQELQQHQKNMALFCSTTNNSDSIQLKYQKKSSVLLETTKPSVIISPGIFFAAIIKTHHQNQSLQSENLEQGHPVHHRLFVTVPDYGILKNHSKYVENATFLDTSSPVKEIVPITSLFNATNRPEGYANEFATQYSSINLKIAVLTNTSIETYTYRTPDMVFESSIDNPLPFVLNYGLAEACSSALFVTCKLNKSESIRSKALTFFTVGIPGIIEIKPKYNNYAMGTVSTFLTKPTVNLTPQKALDISKITTTTSNKKSNYNLEDVLLSPRFYGILLLITRLFRDIWDKPVFTLNSSVKFNSQSKLIKESVLNNNLISQVSITKSDVDYYLSSIIILNEFFNTYGNSIANISSPYFLSNKLGDKSEEIAYQAENIAINSVIKLVQSMKEALSFLNVLFEESSVDGCDDQYVSFNDIVTFLTIQTQEELSVLKYKDIFAPNDHSKKLVREILSSIINRNISKGGSVEYIATALQERCGSFCSTGDVLGFRAIEHLRKAKEIGLRDFGTLDYHLTHAIKLFEKIVDDISLDKIKEAVRIMLELHYHPKTIEFLLNVANSTDKGKLAYQYVADGCLEHDERKKYFDKRIVIYDLVFETLINVDELSSKVDNSMSGLVIKGTGMSESNEMSKLREESYKIALTYNDKLFHYQLYDWLVSQSSQEKLLELDTDFILPYLQEKSVNSLEISNLLWVYQSKRSNFFAAAQILYNLSISDFHISLGSRIEYLSRANGFCNSICSPSQRLPMIQLSGMIKEIFDVAVIQDDILTMIRNDSRIKPDTQKDLINQLDGKILTINDLFNDFADPLSYYEICLSIFKASDFRNHEEIMSKWQEMFESLTNELNVEKDMESSLNFINLLSNVMTKVGKSVHTSEFVFPINELFPIVCNLFYENLPKEHIKNGTIASIFISASVSYDKLYYVVKNLIEMADASCAIYSAEMLWIIKEWYQSDRKLRDIITFDEIRNLEKYTLETDPIYIYMKKTGNII